MVQAFYFGVGDSEKGHFWWIPSTTPGRLVRAHGNVCSTLGPIAQCVDDVFTPDSREGVAQLIYFNHNHRYYTMIAFSDCSGDPRPASNSAFVIVGTLSFEDMVNLSREYFPSVWSRFTFSVVRWQPPERHIERV